MARPVLLPQAVDDLQRIRRYIAQYDVRAAKRVVERIRQRILMLGRQPLIGELRDDLRPGLRSFPSGSYIIYYEPTQPRISILRVLHGARDHEGLV
jgi:toxin ParE1/3/4